MLVEISYAHSFLKNILARTKRTRGQSRWEAASKKDMVAYVNRVLAYACMVRGILKGKVLSWTGDENGKVG